MLGAFLEQKTGPEPTAREQLTGEEEVDIEEGGGGGVGVGLVWGGR